MWNTAVDGTRGNVAAFDRGVCKAPSLRISNAPGGVWMRTTTVFVPFSLLPETKAVMWLTSRNLLQYLVNQ